MPENRWYVWVVMCGKHCGRGHGPRVFRGRSEACTARDEMRDAGCWEGQAPEFHVERMTIFSALADDSLEAEVRTLMPAPGTRIPAQVLRDTAAALGMVAVYGHSCARLKHTHALILGCGAQGVTRHLEGERYLDMIGHRPIVA